MDFEIAHTLSASPDDVARALLDQEFQNSLKDLGALADRRVLSQTEDAGGRVRRETRCVLGIDMGAAGRFLGSSEPAWVEDATWDPGRLRWDWVIKPEVAADLLKASGITVIEPDGDGAVRRVTGSVRIRVPLYGSKVEGWIVQGLEESYDEEARRLAEWLAR
ncbi:MAG TPA: DUF2505 domain-containing protein [Actinomycetota bacterium]|jgi:hypothetical protein